MPTETPVSGILNRVAGREFLAGAHAEAALRLDGGHHDRPVEFHLDPLLAVTRPADRLPRAPSAARVIQVEPVI